MKVNYSKIIISLFCVLSLVLFGCAQEEAEGGVETPTEVIEGQPTIPEKTSTPAPEPAPAPDQPVEQPEASPPKKLLPDTIRFAPLLDFRTREIIKIADFEGKPILLESFAVWCPVCLSQQKQLDILERQQGNKFIHISIDTDPNENEKIVQQHLDRYKFRWHFVVSTPELNQALLDEFGISVLNAPSAPIVLICEDQSARLLRNGVKLVAELLEEVAKGC